MTPGTFSRRGLDPQIGVVGDQYVHPGIEEGLDFALQVPNGRLVGCCCGSAGQEGAFASEVQPTTSSPGGVSIRDDPDGRKEPARRIAGNHDVLAEADVVGMAGDVPQALGGGQVRIGAWVAG
jgi:hypothetical protein